MHQDFKELLSVFNAVQVRYLIVGGYAVSFHAQPRATKDLDILIGADVENGKAALAKFGAQIEGLSAKDFTERGPQDRSAERDQEARPTDLSGSPDKGLDDDLN